MLGKTHFSVGMAAGLALCRPQSITMLVAGTAVAGFGGIISDIDVGTSGAYNKVDRIIGLAVGTIIGIVIADVIFHVGIYDRLMADSNIARIITGILAFLCICIFGMKQPHRSFMHSILALLGLGFFVYVIFPDVAPYFSIGFISHMVIDALNGKREKLFWPIGKGFALRMCSSNGLVNKLLFHISSLLVLILILTSRPVLFILINISGLLQR